MYEKNIRFRCGVSLIKGELFRYVILQLEKEKVEESLAREKIAQEKDFLLKEKLATVTELEEKSLKLQDVMHEVNTLKWLEHVYWKIKLIKKLESIPVGCVLPTFVVREEVWHSCPVNRQSRIKTYTFPQRR